MGLFRNQHVSLRCVHATMLSSCFASTLCLLFVDSAGLGGFWAAAASGVSLQRPVPHQRWDADWCYSSDVALGRSYARFAAWAEVRHGCCQVAETPGGLAGKV